MTGLGLFLFITLLPSITVAYSSIDQRSILRYQRAREQFLKQKSTEKLMMSLRADPFGKSIDCGDDGDILHVTNFSMIPSFIPLPGNITINVSVRVDTDLSAPISAEVTMRRHYFFMWMRVPCVDNFGSCTYDDLCAMLPNADDPPADPCPSDLVALNVPCKCPIKGKSYALHNFQVELPDTEFPLEGLYSVEAILKHEDVKIGCIQLQIEVEQMNGYF